MTPSNIVGNAHLFMVLHDMDTKKEYGVHFEITDPHFIYGSHASGGSLPVTLNGDCFKQEAYDLGFCKSGSIERLSDESV